MGILDSNIHLGIGYACMMHKYSAMTKNHYCEREDLKKHAEVFGVK